MLRITVSESSQAALNYFGQSLSRGDYYMEGQEIAGSWGGIGAQRLGLRGAAEKEVFALLLENKRPDGSALTSKTIENRRPGYDFTFDVPKSVSILHLLTGDERIVSAMRAAITATMIEMEGEMHARVRKGGMFKDRKTGNMIWADFVHLTSRPTLLPPEVEKSFLARNPWMASFRDSKGRLSIPDPHLHAHVFVINATYDAAENLWKAGEFMRLKRDASYYQAAYHSRLAGELQKLGYSIEPTANAFEIAGVARSVIEGFSRRMKEVEEAAKRLGIVSDAQKDGLGALTRRGKVPELGINELKQIWRGLLPASVLAKLDGIETTARRVVNGRAIDDRTMADAGIRFALGHELERVSEVSEKRLLGRALTRTVGHAGVDTVRHVLRANPRLLFAEAEGERHLTTPEVLAEESALLDMVRLGRGQCLPLVPGRHEFQHPIFKANDNGTKEQRAAIDQLLRSSDWIVGLVGRAGTGKTTVLKEMDVAVRGAGKKLLFCAPTAEASRGVLRSEGFANAETVKQFITDPRLHAQMKGAVLWVDEAGMLGNRDMLALLRIAKREGAARVILSGDSRQIRSVPRGDAFQFLEQKGGLSVARLDTIRRQKNPELRAVVDSISKGAIVEAMQSLEKVGSIREADTKNIRKELARDYADKIGQRKTALVISPTHSEGDQVTAVIRDELRARGKIGAKEQTILRTVNLSWTEKQRGCAASFEPGLVVQFKQNAPGFRRSERVMVSAVDARAEKVLVQTNLGTQVQLPLAHAAKFQVYGVREMPVAVGDRLKVTENSLDETGRHRLTNGDLVTVAGFSPSGGVVLENKWTLPRDFGHLAHGYVITADSAQAKTVDAVFLAIGQESLAATDMRRFYVMVSRAREDARIYTDDKEGLMRSAQRESVRLSATDLIGEKRSLEVLRGQQLGEAQALADKARRQQEQAQAQENARRLQQEKVKAAEAERVRRLEIERARAVEEAARRQREQAQAQERARRIQMENAKALAEHARRQREVAIRTANQTQRSRRPGITHER